MNLKFPKEQVLFLDIETVPLFQEFQKAPIIEQELFATKTKYKRGDDISAEEFYAKAGIWAEFGRIVCISVGYFSQNKLRITSFSNDDEKQLLLNFSDLLKQYFNKKEDILCGHNAKEFDFPFIGRRMIINGVTLPDKLNLIGKKPWEVSHLDTLEMWKFGDYKHYTSLKLLTHILNIPSPKGDIDGSQVADVYYKEKNIKRIVNYCEQDVLALVRVFMRFNNEDLILDEDVVFV